MLLWLHSHHLCRLWFVSSNTGGSLRGRRQGLKDSFRNTPLWLQTVSSIARRMAHTARRQAESPCPTLAPQFCHHYLPPPCWGSPRKHHVLAVSWTQTMQDYCTQVCEKHRALHPHSTQLQKQTPWEDHIPTVWYLPSLSACYSLPLCSSPPYSQTSLGVGQKVWSKQKFTSVHNLFLLSTIEVYYIHKGGWVLQVQFANDEVFLLWTAATLAAENRAVPRTAWLERLATEAKALTIWVQRSLTCGSPRL